MSLPRCDSRSTGRPPRTRSVSKRLRGIGRAGRAPDRLPRSEESSFAPMAASSGRALSRHSSSSRSGSESATIPPPTPSQALPRATSKVRIATFSSSPDNGLAIPMAPVYTSREVASRVARSSIARTFGAPVTDPGGKSPATGRRPMSPRTAHRSRPRRGARPPGEPRLGRDRARATLPYRHTRPRSLRMRSTIITFSARSLSEPSNRSRWRGEALPPRRALDRRAEHLTPSTPQEQLGREAGTRTTG